MVFLVRFAVFACLLLTSPTHARDVRDLAESLETKAMNGDMRAAYKLGLLWSDGKKVDPDYFSAIEWFQRAANQGYVRAMLKLADLNLNDKVLTPDLDRARFWLEKAAMTGSRDGMSKLGQFYAGTGDVEQAAQWYRKAAIKGDARAMSELGLYYYRGTGVRFDLSHAFAWLELAAQRKDRAARVLQRDILHKKGEQWVKDLRRQINNRMIPKEYWDAR
jgi:TPR repeat protein